MKTALTFDSHYSVAISEFSGTGMNRYFPGGDSNGGKDGVTVTVSPDSGAAWTGIFAFGDITPNGVTGIFSMPDPDQLCVVSRGEGYLVSSSNPNVNSQVLAKPVIDLISVPEAGLIIFADYTTLVAYDANGVKWESGSVAPDGFKILGVEGEILKGQFLSLRTDRYEVFTVSLADGTILSGREFL